MGISGLVKETDFRFPKSCRLLNKTEFERVFSDGQRVRDGFFTVLYRPNGLNHPRLGLAVSRRQLPKAVQRNRVKRLVRESFRHHKNLLGSTDLVIMVRSGVKDVDNKVLFASLAKLWGKISRRIKQGET